MNQFYNYANEKIKLGGLKSHAKYCWKHHFYAKFNSKI